MRIPLVTSIWRGLAGMDDSLRLAWAAAKPIYESGEPERALDAQCCCGRLASSGIVGAHRTCLRGTDGRRYRRGACCRCCLQSLEWPEPDGTGRLGCAVGDGGDYHDGRWCGGITATLGAAATAAAAGGDRSGYWAWDMIRHVNAFGSSGVDAEVATLWRHLAHWPALLALIHGAFAPLQITRTDRRGERPAGCAWRGGRRAHGH